MTIPALVLQQYPPPGTPVDAKLYGEACQRVMDLELDLEESNALVGLLREMLKVDRK